MLNFALALAVLFIGFLPSHVGAQVKGLLIPSHGARPGVQLQPDWNPDSAEFVSDLSLEKLRHGYDWELLKRMHTAPGLLLRTYEPAYGNTHPSQLPTDGSSDVPHDEPVCFYVYPNPVSDLISVEHCGSYPLLLEIWGTDGILRGVIKAESPGRQISLGHLRPGTYLLVSRKLFSSQLIHIVH